MDTPAPYSLKNKSFLVNAICIIAILIGHLLVPPPFQNHLLSAAYFGFSGAITNWLAVHMLFERVPGLYGSGIIPLKFEAFKSAIRQMIMTQFFSPENIEKFLNDSGGKGKQIDPILANLNYDLVFDAFIEIVLASKFGGMLGMFGGAKALESMRPNFIVGLREKLIELSKKPEFLSSLSSNNDDQDIHQQWSEKIGGIVDARLEELTPQMVKNIIQNMIRSHLGWLVVWGGVFGGFIGLITSFFLK